MAATPARPRREFARQELEKELAHDYSTSADGIVPQDERRSRYHFLGIWVTFSAGFTYLFLGFQFHDSGYSLGKAVAAGALGGFCYLCYALPASYLGSKTGQTHALLTRSIFGVLGSAIVSLLLIGVAAGFAAFAWNLLGQIFDGLFGWGHIALIGVLLAVAGIFNNLFGFTGVAAFARYLVAPLMIIWILYLCVKGFAQLKGLGAVPALSHGSLSLPFLSGIALAIGSVMWGNEPDTWRYGRPRFWWPAVPYLVAMAIGMILFVMGGWMMAQVSTAGPFDFGLAFKDTVMFSLFGAFWLGAVIAVVLQVAINDGNYYEMVNGGQNIIGHLRGWKRWYTCLIMAAITAVLTWWFARNPNIEGNFFKVASWSAIALPCATTVMCADQFLLPRLFGVRRVLEPIPSWRAAAPGNWPAIVSVLAAVAFGAWGQQLFPGEGPPPALGLVPVEAWIMAGVLYIAITGLIARLPSARSILGFARPARSAARVAATTPEAGR